MEEGRRGSRWNGDRLPRLPTDATTSDAETYNSTEGFCQRRCCAKHRAAQPSSWCVRCVMYVRREIEIFRVATVQIFACQNTGYAGRVSPILFCFDRGTLRCTRRFLARSRVACAFIFVKSQASWGPVSSSSAQRDLYTHTDQLRRNAGRFASSTGSTVEISCVPPLIYLYNIHM